MALCVCVFGVCLVCVLNFHPLTEFTDTPTTVVTDKREKTNNHLLTVGFLHKLTTKNTKINHCFNIFELNNAVKCDRNCVGKSLTTVC